MDADFIGTQISTHNRVLVWKPEYVPSWQFNIALKEIIIISS